MIDDRAFAGEVSEQLLALYRLSYSILRSRADAQDAVQQGLLRAWERRAQASPQTFRGWLTRIVINECHNIQRRRMRVFPVGEMPEGEQAPQENERLAEAIDALPERLRTPLLMRYMEDYSEREIAAALGVPATTVKNRLFRARKALKKYLGHSEVTFE